MSYKFGIAELMVPALKAAVLLYHSVSLVLAYHESD